MTTTTKNAEQKAAKGWHGDEIVAGIAVQIHPDAKPYYEAAGCGQLAGIVVWVNKSETVRVKTEFGTATFEAKHVRRAISPQAREQKRIADMSRLALETQADCRRYYDNLKAKVAELRAKIAANIAEHGVCYGIEWCSGAESEIKLTETLRLLDQAGFLQVLSDWEGGLFSADDVLVKFREMRDRWTADLARAPFRHSSSSAITNTVACFQAEALASLVSPDSFEFRPLGELTYLVKLLAKMASEW